MDKIIINGLTLYAHHGVDEREQAVGQRFYIDIELRGDLSRAGRSNEIKDTIDYREVCEIVTDVVKGKRYHLLEALADDVARRLLQRFRPTEVMVRIRKPNPSIDGLVDYVGCEVIRGGDK